MDLGKKMYCSHCEQTYYTTDTDKCSLCGKAGGLVSPEVGIEMEQQRQLERNVKAMSAGTMPRRMLYAWRSIRWFVGGMAMIVLGLWFFFSQDLRGGDPRNPKLIDFLPGVGAIIAGFVVCFFAYRFWPRTKRIEP